MLFALLVFPLATASAVLGPKPEVDDLGEKGQQLLTNGDSTLGAHGSSTLDTSLEHT